MPTVTLIEAVTMAMDHEMSVDEDVVVLGEDVGRNGGVFRATDGLQEKHGEDRVIDTPLAEAMIAGLSVGMAAQGMKPIAGSIATLRILSGVLAATSSISMPPSLEAMIVIRLVARSISTPR